MATLRNREGSVSDYIGLRVHSKKVGSREAFDGIITGYCGEGFYVQDEDGRGWVRNLREFSIIEEDQS